jgi:hypothetical protein
MHPEVREDTAGCCPKSGMALVFEGTERTHHKAIADEIGPGQPAWRSYIPLLVIFALLLGSASVVSLRDSLIDSFSWVNSIAYFMAGFFLVFAGFKLMDLEGFAEGYSTYDLLAQRWFGYGYVYPFIELAFGLAMLGGVNTPSLLWAEIVVMVFSGAGVTMKLMKGEKFQCACLGTFLKVPLSKITLIEDFGMAALAIVLLLIS